MDKRDLSELIEYYTGKPLIKYSEFIKMSVEQRQLYLLPIYRACMVNGITFKIGFTNEKGGTGKTFLSANVAYTASQLGFDVLAIDGDPQATFTSLIGANLEPGENKAFEKRIEKIELDPIYEDLDAFKPRPLTEIDISKEFNLPKKMDGIVPLMEKMFIEKEVPCKEDYEGIILTPTYFITDTETPIKNKDGSFEYMDSEKPYGFDFIPSSSALSNYSLSTVVEKNRGRAYHLSAAMERLLEYQKSEKGKIYNITICDMPPSVETVTLNDMTYCEDGVFGVITPNTEVANGIFSVMETLQNMMIKLEESNPEGIRHTGIPAVIMNKASRGRDGLSNIMSPPFLRWYFQTRSLETRLFEERSATKNSYNEHILPAMVDKKVISVIYPLTLELLYLVLLSRIETNERQKNELKGK